MKQATARPRASTVSAASTARRSQGPLHCKWESCTFITHSPDSGKALLDHWRKDHGMSYRATTTNPNITVECHWGNCSKRFRPGSYSTEAHIRGHLARELGWKEFTCKLCSVHFTRRPDLTAHFKKKHPELRPSNVSSGPYDDMFDMMPTSPTQAFMSPLIGSPSLLPTMLSPPTTRSAGLDGSLSPSSPVSPFQGLVQFGSMSTRVSVDVSAHDSALFLNSPPSVPDMYATLDTNLLLGMPADAFLTGELLSGIGSSSSPSSSSISMEQFHQQLQQQQQQQQSPLQYTSPYAYSPNNAHDFWQDPHDILSSKAVLGAMAATENAASELPLLFGLTDQALDSSTWQMASLTATAHI